MKLFLPIAGVALGAAVLMGANSVTAQSSGESLVDKLAGRFNVESSEVQAVFDEHKEEKRAEHQQERSEKLQAKVDDGTITAEQKTLLEEKFEEMRDSKPDFKNSDLSKEEMREQMQEHRAEFKQWAEDNGIPLEELELRDGKKGFGPGRHGHRGPEGSEEAAE